MYKHSDPHRFFGAQVLPVMGDDLVAAQTILERLDGSAPAPAPPAEQQPQPKQSMPDVVIAALSNLTPKDAQRQSERAELISARHALNERCRAFIERQLAEDHAALAKQHRECRERGRAQEKIVNDLVDKVGAMQNELNKLDGVRAQRAAELESARQERASLGRFAEDAKIASADDVITKCAQRAEKAQAAYAEVAQLRNSVLLRQLPPQQEKLAAIMNELNGLEARLQGASEAEVERLAHGFIG